MRPNPFSIRVDETSTESIKPKIAPDQPSRPAVADPPTEFQLFVGSSVGKRLPLFGYSLFQNVPSTFAPLDHIAVPANYVIGPGDELLIRTWGQIDVDARVKVDRNGQIYLPKVGSVSVAGISYEQLSNHLKEAIGSVFRHFELRVTLGQLRSIQIYIVGYARRPGTYTVGSLSTLVNALFTSGGPSIHGSMRHIELKRGDQVMSSFDMYDLLLKGDKSKDIVLLPGDVIYIPKVGPQVAMSGSVNFPAIYELRSSATLEEELEVAGGLTNVADGERVVVERIENRTTRKVDEFTLDAAGLARQLHDSDLVRVFSISPKFENAVTLRGNVAEPGRYPFRPGMKIRDLMPNKEFLLTRGFWNSQNATGSVPHVDTRNGAAELGVNSGFSVVPPQERASDVPVDAERQNRKRSGSDDWHAQSSVVEGQGELRNEVKRNAPDINWDYAVIQRLNPVDLSTSLISFNLGKAILDGSDSDNIALQAGDVVTIFSQHDIAVSNEHQSKFVKLEGEFRAPGVYKVNPGETLRSLIMRAGGLTGGAFVFGSEFTREVAQKQQQASLDRLVRDLELESQHQAVNSAKLPQDQQGNLQAQMESQRALIQKLREVKATGRIVLEIAPSHTGIDAFPDMDLEDGDDLLVPHKSSMVNVVGAVYNQNSLLFRENRRIGDYLKLSGGGTREADMKYVFVVRADGSVLSRTNTNGMWSAGLASMRVIAGDTIVVPTRLDKGSFMRAIKDWSQIIGQIGLGAAAINVLK
jgi:protein involved in polysaccharide export with SLBB domain